MRLATSLRTVDPRGGRPQQAEPATPGQEGSMSQTTSPPAVSGRVAVLGPGGVGGLLAGLLARRGADVVCLAGAATTDVLARQGICVESRQFGNFSVPVRAAERLGDRADVCLVTVKATQLEDALDRLPARAVGSALLVPLLNGVEHLHLLQRRYPAATVVPATVRCESARIAPGVIRHDSPFLSVEMAAVGRPAHDVRRFAAALSAAGVTVQVSDDAATVMWSKLTFLVALALLTTAAAAPAGEVRQRRRDDLRALVTEAAAVARAEGATVDAAAVVAFFDSIPAGMESSMQRDAATGRSLELDAIAGAVLRAAARHGIAVPVTSRYVEELRSRYGNQPQ
jgi:2-dehydropantoate 2-reductase